MGGLTRAGADGVDVEVERLGIDAQALDAGLLGGLPQGHGRQVGVAVGVAAGLQPALVLGVEQEEHALAGGVDDDRRAR